MENGILFINHYPIDRTRNIRIFLLLMLKKKIGLFKHAFFDLRSNSLVITEYDISPPRINIHYRILLSSFHLRGSNYTGRGKIDVSMIRATKQIFVPRR